MADDSPDAMAARLRTVSDLREFGRRFATERGFHRGRDRIAALDAVVNEFRQ